MIFFPLILPSEKEFVTAAQSRNFPLMFQPHHPVLIAINIKYLCRKFVFLMILYTCKFGGPLSGREEPAYTKNQEH